MRTRRMRWLALLLAAMMVFGLLDGTIAMADQVTGQLVLTLAADITSDQKAEILRYFGITEDEVKVITITNADEHAQLGNLLPESVIGTATLSCALIRLTTSGGIQVKTANMTYVTSNMIASTLLTSGVYNCEVLTAAPLDVSGTGALTGVMMAYEAGTGEQLDPEMKNLANEELVITSGMAETVGQDQATLVVNDIKIHIVRDGITDQAGVVQVVDDVITTTETAAAAAAAEQGVAAPATLGTVETEQLYEFGYKFSQIGYSYSDMQPTLERVTRNITKHTGIQDPITDTFTTTEEDDALPIDSILLNTEDGVMGENANINATNTVALGDHPAETIEVYTGDVRLTEAGKIKAESFIRGSNLVAFKDVNGKYALMDLNGNVLTESIYTNDFRSSYGYIEARLYDGQARGILNSDGAVVVPFQYDVVEVLGNLWGVGAYLVDGTEEDYDYYGSGAYYQIGTMDVYYFGDDSAAPVGTLTRDQIDDAHASGDYLNIRDRSEVVATYDSSFQIVQYPDSLYDSSYDEAYRAAEIVSNQMGISVNRFHGNYATAYQNGKYGVVDRYGNVIVPFEFDYVSTSYDDMIFSGGYAAVRIDDGFAYVLQGGTVTGNFGVDYYTPNNYGMASYYKNDDGVYTLLAGDGTVTVLDSSYTYLSALTASKGLLWRAQGSKGYDLLDWHGNVLLTGASDYSVAANGNYVIAQDGYASSTLYLVNDASPVAIADSSGGALELTADVKEGASLEAYTGDPSVTLLGEIDASEFIDGTSLLEAQDEDTGYWRAVDTNGLPLTEAVYDRYISYRRGWLVATQDGLYGLLSLQGAQALPCEFDYLTVLNENWAVAYRLTPTATEEDYDFYDYVGSSSDKVYYYIDQAVVCHLTPTEISSVTLGRDQIADIQAEEDYINVQDRTSGAVTTYDNTFTAVATVNSVYNFKGFSALDELVDSIRDETGYSISDDRFPDGYSKATSYVDGTTKYGVIDMEGNIVVPVEYDYVESYYNYNTRIWANGYFCVEKDGKVGYVTQGGNVTCALQYPEDSFSNCGAAGYVRHEDGSYTLVAADGTETEIDDYLGSLYGGTGLLWKADSAVGSGYDLIDWHGNVLIENMSSIHISEDGSYVLVQKDWKSPYQLYGVNGAVPEGGFIGVSGPEPEPEPEEPAVDPAEAQALLDIAHGLLGGGAAEEAEPEPETGETAPDAVDPQALLGIAQGLLGGGAAEEAEPEEPTAEAPADAALDASGAKGLLEVARTLASSDAQSNKAAISALLTEAQSALEETDPGAAVLVGSAIQLLSGDTVDGSAVSTLLDTAISLLE